MPNSYVNKVTVNNATIIDLTSDTAVASDVASGKYFHLATGERVAGTASGGGGDTYTRTVVVPQQTFTPQESANNSYQAILTYTAGLEDGETYLVTFDGEQYACECGVLWGSDYMAGAIGTFWGERSDNPYPFGIDYAPSTPEFAVATYDLNQHTIKVEHLEFVDGPLTIITKSITANGTYNASSDNADGYSSVTVNVSGGSATYRLDNIVPEQTVACTTFMQNNAYYGMATFSSPIDDAEQYLVTFDGTEYVCEGHVPEANATGVGDIRVANTNAAQNLITPFFIEYQASLGIGLIVRGSGTHTVKVDKLTFIDDGETFTTKTITENGTYNASSDGADGYSSVMVNVPTGGGASNIVQGSFTGTTAGSALDVSVNYNGNGYPIALFIWVDGGVVGNSTFNSAVQRYAIASYTVLKTHESYEPTYNPSSSSSDNHDRSRSMNIARYKSSTSSATSYANQANNAVYAFSNASAESSLLSAVRIKSDKVFSVYIASSGNGFMTNIKYNYVIVYSE